MKRTDKKGFTIVELVIVIAVIAILAAVLIPNISKLVRKANESSDLSLVRNLNTALSMETKDYATAHEAFEAVKEAGYDLTKIEAKADENKILYDSENKCFVYLKGDKLEYYPNSKKVDLTTADYYKLWMVCSTIDDNDGTYSIYWNGGDVTETIHVENVGFDAANASVAGVSYTGNKGNSVLLRTNSFDTIVTVDAESDEVKHYGNAKEISIIRVKMGTYTEYGNVLGNISIAKGKVEVANGASVANIIVKALIDGENNTVSPASKDEIAVVVNRDAQLSTVSSELEAITTSEITVGDGADKVGKVEHDDTKIAYVNGIGYTSLLEAIEALRDNETLVLRSNVTLDEELDIRGKNNVTIDLNGCTINSNESRGSGHYAILIVNCSLTIKGNGEINGEKLAERQSVIKLSASTLNLIDGTINGIGFKVYGILATEDSTVNLGIQGSTNGPSINTNSACLSVNGNKENAEAVYNIYGGTYIATRDTGDSDSNVIQISNADGNTKKYTVNIYGGIFRQTGNPADGKSNILELRHTGAKAINIYGGVFYCNGEIENHYANDTTVVNDVNGAWKKSN